ncbi:MAG TPA: hypothetical protein VJ835_09320 [Fimbriimonadaceae bacterium]|nr:hypothetical protein [Fimbriimonadaceae bacterium]
MAFLLIGLPLAIVTIHSVATSQGYGNGNECYATMVDSCLGEAWDYQESYPVICCCGSGGAGSAGNECICGIDRYQDI